MCLALFLISKIMISNNQVESADNMSDDIFYLNKVIRHPDSDDSFKKLDTYFGDLKSGIIVVNSELKIIYFNSTTKLLFTEGKEIHTEKMPILEAIKHLLEDKSKLLLYESLLNKKQLKLDTGLNLKSIQQLHVNPIGEDGFIFKFILDELFTVSASNLFKYFPELPVSYFGFDLLAGKRISIRFVSDNFGKVFPFLDQKNVLENENYFLSHIAHEDLPQFVSKLQHLKRGKNSFTYEFRMNINETEHRWFKLIAGRFNEKTEKNFWLAYLEDIHEKKTILLEREKLVYETLDEEQSRFAMELHDGLGQNLVGVNLYLSMVKDNPESENNIAICKQLIQDSILQMKSICYNLTPPELDKGLLYALDVYFGKQNELSKLIGFNFIAKQVPMNHLDLKSKYNIFRIVQEFVTNSIKYANCSQIDCTIYSKENTIYLEIKDNGIGFDLESVKKGMGLNNMHKRAFLCGAKLELETSKEHGTKLVVLF